MVGIAAGPRFDALKHSAQAAAACDGFLMSDGKWWPGDRVPEEMTFPIRRKKQQYRWEASSKSPGSALAWHATTPTKQELKKKSASPASKALLSRGRTIATRSIEHIVGSTPKAMIALALATAPTSRALLADRSLRRRSGVPRHHGLHNLSFSVTQLLPSPHGSQSRPSAAERGSHTARARAPSTVCGSHPSAPA